MSAKPFNAILEKAREQLDYWVEGAILDFTEDVTRRMDSLNVHRSELANRLDAKPAFVTKLLRGNNNFTILTMVKVARALDSAVRIHLEPEGAKCHWFDVFKKTDVKERPHISWIQKDQHFKKVKIQEKEIADDTFATAPRPLLPDEDLLRSTG